MTFGPTNAYLCLSQESYERYSPKLRDGGLLIVDQDLVDTVNIRATIKCAVFPFTVQAEKMNRRIVANVIALGVLAVETDAVKPESIAKAIPSRLPERNVAIALAAWRSV